MPRTVHPGGSSSPNPSQARGAKSAAAPRTVPPAIIVVVIVLLVVAISAGAWYTYNGGWKTAGQQERVWRQEGLPVFLAARKGNYALLNRVNAERAKEGKPPLQVPAVKPQRHLMR